MKKNFLARIYEEGEFKVKNVVVEKIDDLFYRNLTEKQKENLKKIKEFLEKENQKAREHQKARGVRQC